jgi:hypothetical protein
MADHRLCGYRAKERVGARITLTHCPRWQKSQLPRGGDNTSTSRTATSRNSRAYAFDLAKNHPFIDGNKRTAFLALEHPTRKMSW